MANMTREEMVRVVEEGGSFFFRDDQARLHLIHSRDRIPSEAQIAQASGSTTDKAAAKKALDERIKLLQAEAAALDEPTPAKPEAKADPAKPLPPAEPAAPAKVEPAKVEPPKGK